jgi:uncharacterized protein involved in exopolysaccharide biosynthesis
MLALDQQALFLDSQLAQVSPTSGAVTETGQRMLSSEDRLKYLKTQLASARSLYEPDHPDVIRLTREVAGLERELGGQNAGNELVRQLQETRKQLGQARARYSAEHPDVRRLERLVDAMEDAMRRAGQTATPTVSTAKPDNPAFIQLRAQKDAVTTERAALARQRDQLRARVSDLTSRMSAAPGVEREYSALARDLQGAQLKYQEVRQKQMAAQLAQNLETEQKGERFTLIEPPLVPEQPATPNRALILVLGSLLSVAAAIAFAMLVESVDGRVRGSRDLAGIVGVPPLAVIPWVELDEERKSRRGRWRIWLAAAAAGLLALLALVHFLYRPLDVLWSVVLRRLWL